LPAPIRGVTDSDFVWFRPDRDRGPSCHVGVLAPHASSTRLAIALDERDACSLWPAPAAVAKNEGNNGSDQQIREDFVASRHEIPSASAPAVRSVFPPFLWVAPLY